MAATASSLPLGTRLGEFELTGVLGEGGFSVVYLALDHSLGRTVAIKEFMPSTIATRLPNGTVVPKAPQREDAFKAGLTSFQEEARLLTRFTHSALIHIHRIWEQNGTAYMAMQYCVGKTLRQIRHAEPEVATSEDWLKATFAPILDALALLHTENCFHRDISPDNILILQSGAPVLLDFGAARQIIGDMTQALTVILKPGFAPIEQYADDTSLQQGTWTDVYGVGAVLYYMLIGKPPVASVARLVKDPMIKLADADEFAHLSRPFREAIDHALAVYPQQRIQSIPELCEALQLPVFMPNAFFGGEVAHVAPAPEAEAVEPVHSETRSKSVASAVLDSYQSLQNSVLTRLTGRSAPPAATEPDPGDAGVPADAPAASAAEPDPVPDASPGAEISSTFLASAAAFQHRSARRRKVLLGMAALAVVAAGLIFAAPNVLPWFSSGADTHPRFVNDGPPTTEKLPIAPAPDSSATTASADHPTVAVSATDAAATPQKRPPSATSSATTAAAVQAAATPMPTATTNAQSSSASTETAPVQTPAGRKKPRRSEERPVRKITPPVAMAAPPQEPVFPAPMSLPAPAPVLAASKKLNAATADTIPVKTSVVQLLIKPWGAVSVDGQPKGVSPPLTHLSLTPGAHQIVITNGDFPPVTQTVMVPETGNTAVFHRFSVDW